MQTHGPFSSALRDYRWVFRWEVITQKGSLPIQVCLFEKLRKKYRKEISGRDGGGENTIPGAIKPRKLLWESFPVMVD